MMLENSAGALDFDFNKNKEDNGRDDWFGSRFDKISNVYLDKEVMEYPSVRLVDCCRENSCSVVKDIVVDDGLRLKDKILLESGNNKIDQELSKEINMREIFDSEEAMDFSNKISLVQGDWMEKDEERKSNINMVDRRSTRISGAKTDNKNGRITIDFKSSSPIPTLEFHQRLGSSIDENQNPRPQIDKIPYACSVLSQSQDSASLADDSDLVARTNGGASFRSNSSTTSNRSFAFPILQSEWNSSPVRMAKADRRQLRKLRGWRQGLLCCRF